jgi:hypothetical protein
VECLPAGAFLFSRVERCPYLHLSSSCHDRLFARRVVLGRDLLLLKVRFRRVFARHSFQVFCLRILASNGVRREVVRWLIVARAVVPSLLSLLGEPWSLSCSAEGCRGRGGAAPVSACQV